MLLDPAVMDWVVLDCHRLDDIIREHYGKDYSTLEAIRKYEHYGQDSMFSVELYNVDELKVSTYTWGDNTYTTDHPAEHAEEFGKWEDANSSPDPSVILSDLYTRGLIPKANYEIRIWW